MTNDDDGCRICSALTNNAEPYCHACLQGMAEDAADARRDAHDDAEPDSHATLGLREDDE